MTAPFLQDQTFEKSLQRGLFHIYLMVSFLFAGITISVSVDTEIVCQSG
jgi:hypothetical protein